MKRKFELTNWDNSVEIEIEIDTEIFTEQEALDCLSFYGQLDDADNFDGDVRVAAINLIGEQLAYMAPAQIGFSASTTDSEWIWKEYQDYYREGPCFACGVTVTNLETSFDMDMSIKEI